MGLCMLISFLPFGAAAKSAPPLLNPADYPAFGPWMLSPAGTPANWLNQPYKGKELLEPINIIIIDSKAKSAEEARDRMLKNCARAGYPGRYGHSTGYQGMIDSQIHSQLPTEEKQAFSDGCFLLSNNHGRIFGPRLYRGQYYFSAAFSREGLDLFARVKHIYLSFNIARNDFARQLDRRTDYHIIGRLELGNCLPPDSKQTTGDHDGCATVLITK